METESLSDLNVQRQYYYYCKPDKNKTAIFQHKKKFFCDSIFEEPFALNKSISLEPP